MNYKINLKLIAYLLLCMFMNACSEPSENDRSTLQSTDPKIKKLKLPVGFKAERIYSPGEQNQGSWVSMTFDDKGRIITSDQYGYVYRLTLAQAGDSSLPAVEKIRLIHKDSTAKNIGRAQGLLWAFNSLYASVNNLDENEFYKSGIYRLQDTDGDDQFDKVTLLKTLHGEGEHGPHSLKLSPDGKFIYAIAGNFTPVPKADAYKIPNNWKEDNLFPKITDPSGHAAELNPPGGWIARMDSIGSYSEIVSAGYRNSYDMAFNEAGDLFVYDSDMEYDFGLPWYRPTRVVHATLGADFGWRTGSINAPATNADNLPALVNIGQGSPTNLVYAGAAKFPEKYRKSLLAFDWSFGIIYSIHLTPKGASYTAQTEEFISGAPLPLTDGVIGPDGALYFMTGGRQLDSDVYRITYEGKLDKEKNETAVTLPEEALVRRQLEEYLQPNKEAVAIAWPHLSSNDRYVRYTAKTVIEHQPVDEWKEKFFREENPISVIHASLALAKNGSSTLRDDILKKLNQLDFTSLTSSQQIDLLRAYELVLVRMGFPSGEIRSATIDRLDAHYPSSDNFVNRGLSKLLIRLESPTAVPKTMELLAHAKDDTLNDQTFTKSSDLIFRNPQYGLDIANMLSKVPPAQQTYYAIMLSTAKKGWTPELQDQYFKWFHDAFNYKGGVSFIGFINRGRQLALANVEKSKYAYFNTISGDSLLSKSGGSLVGKIPQPKGPWRQWKLDAAIDTIAAGAKEKRNFEVGKNMFAATKCISCHSMRGEGETIGPDLTQLGTRFSVKDILEAIIDPNKTISDQYHATVLTLKDGKTIVGRLISQDQNNYMISQNPFAPQELRTISKKEVVNTKPSDVSIMLPGMINPLNAEELKDLMAYLQSGGNEAHPIYTNK